jgi:hypothetical protein
MRDLLINTMLVLAIVAVVGFMFFGMWMQTEAISECKARGFARGDWLVNGDIVCYRGEVISRR